jgi:hypothetical protein
MRRDSSRSNEGDTVMGCIVCSLTLLVGAILAPSSAPASTGDKGSRVVVVARNDDGSRTIKIQVGSEQISIYESAPSRKNITNITFDLPPPPGSIVPIIVRTQYGLDDFNFRVTRVGTTRLCGKSFGRYHLPRPNEASNGFISSNPKRVLIGDGLILVCDPILRPGKNCELMSKHQNRTFRVNFSEEELCRYPIHFKQIKEVIDAWLSSKK